MHGGSLSVSFVVVLYYRTMHAANRLVERAHAKMSRSSCLIRRHQVLTDTRSLIRLSSGLNWDIHS